MLYKGGPVKVAHNPAGVSILGAFNNREQQTKKLAKQTATRLEKQSIETLNQQNKQQMQKLKIKEKDKPAVFKAKKLVKKNAGKVSQNITLAQTTAITLSVINNVSNITKNMINKGKAPNQENNDYE